MFTIIIIIIAATVSVHSHIMLVSNRYVKAYIPSSGISTNTGLEKGPSATVWAAMETV